MNISNRVTRLTRLLGAALVVVPALAAFGCGGGGGGTSSAFAPYVGRYVATLTSTAPAGDANPEKAIIGFDVKADGTIDASVTSYAMAQTFTATGRLAETGSISQPVTGTLTGGGVTFTFNGSVTPAGSDITGSGTWSYSNGAGVVKSGTWTGGKAPATHKAIGNWTGSYTMENGSTGEFLINIDAAGVVTGQIGGTGPATRSIFGEIGRMSTRTGEIVFADDDPFPPASVTASVALAIQGTIDMVAGNAFASGAITEVELAGYLALNRGTTDAVLHNLGFTNSISLIAKPDQTGTMTSTLTGGLEYDSAEVVVGDNQLNRKHQGYITYDFAGIPSSATIVSATLTVDQVTVEGDPFSGTSIFLEPVTFATRPTALGGSFPTADARDLLTNTTLGNKTIDVTDLVQAAWHADKPQFQVRIRRLPETDDDSVTDRSNMKAGRLTVVYQP